MQSVIVEKLSSAAEAFPDKAAFTEVGGETLTFRGLLSRALAFAGMIKAAPCEGDRPVAIVTGRGVQSIAALFGAIIAGRWYVMIDSELPPERIRAMTSAADPCVIISDTDVSLPENTVRLSLSHAYPDVPEGFTPAERDSSLPLFGIFTSGSTGKPKLVVKSADAMFSFTDVYCRTFGFTSDEVFGNQIPFFFDASTKDIFATVWLGASCVMLPPSAFAFPVNLVSLLNENRVTTIVWVPSALSVAARFNVFSAAVPYFLKNVLFVGERMPVKYLNAWRQALPECRFVNLYGSTEVAGNSCYYEITSEFADSDVLPIGRPFEGTKLFILDPDTHAPSEEGEICVSGPGLADGYLGDPEKTASVFREMTIGDFTGRVYFSGDFGKFAPDGNCICVSRRDSQIKHMGHRIELGEIETSAGAVPYVNEACCRYDAENEKIILFFSAEEDRGRDLRRELSAVLPKYEIPHRFVYLPSLPHNRNGKIDRAALDAMTKELSLERKNRR